jgi:hypothetical protein
MLIFTIFSINLYLIVFIGIKFIIDVSLIKCSFLARLLVLYSITNKGIAISTGKFGVLIGFGSCQDGEAK